MDLPLRRIIGSLALLLGVTFLTVGLYTGQLDTVVQIMKRILEASIAGARKTEKTKLIQIQSRETKGL